MPKITRSPKKVEATPRVLVIEAQIKQYRAPFYELLFTALAGDGVELRVAYSDPPASERGKQDAVDLPGGYGVKVKARWFLGERLLWQSIPRELRRSELVIVDQGNRFILNHLLLPLSGLGLKKVAFWGLGENRQRDRVSLSEWYKRKTLNWASWWFAYTQETVDYLVRRGVSRDKITDTQNAVDSRALAAAVSAMDARQKAELRQALGIAPDGSAGLYCGILHPAKDLPFLLQACELIREKLPKFELLILGGGPQRRDAERLVAGRRWLHLLGPKFGLEKARLFGLADVCLMPGRVGLVILDSFAAGLPLLTTDIPVHGPEASYLEEGHNGLRTAHEIPAYAAAVVEVLSSPSYLESLRRGAVESGRRYTMEAMVQRFRTGVLACLGRPVVFPAERVRVRSDDAAGTGSRWRDAGGSDSAVAAGSGLGGDVTR